MDSLQREEAVVVSNMYLLFANAMPVLCTLYMYTEVVRMVCSKATSSESLNSKVNSQFVLLYVQMFFFDCLFDADHLAGNALPESELLTVFSVYRAIFFSHYSRVDMSLL